MAASEPSPPGVPGAAILRLYPPAWRRRYADEMLEVLGARPLTIRARFDLLRGAVDAWLHPAEPSLAPALGALAGGGAWTLAGTYALVQPVPVEWPGYAFDTLPLVTLGVLCLLVAVVGAWLRLGDGAGGAATVAVDLAIAGHLAWLAALIGVLIGVDYGLSTVVASSAAAFGAVAVGWCLLRAGHERIGTLIVVTPVAMLIAAPAAWLAFGLGWTTIGWLQLPTGRGVPAA